MGDTHNHPPEQSPGQEGGASVLDLADLAPTPLRVVRLMLRQGPMTYAELCRATAALPEVERVSQPDLDESLETLSLQGWISRTDELEPIYKVNLRGRASGARAEGRPRSQAARDLSKKIWTALDPDGASRGPGSGEAPDC
jgi:hypothetical protein